MLQNINHFPNKLIPFFQITAYSALEKMGLICLENDLYFATQEGAKVHGSLDRNGVYKELPEELFRL